MRVLWRIGADHELEREIVTSAGQEAESIGMIGVPL